MTRLDDIEARAAAATAGPFDSDDVGYGWCDEATPLLRVTCRLDACVDDAVCFVPCGDPCSAAQAEADAAFLAAAREDVPWMAARIRELEKQIEHDRVLAPGEYVVDVSEVDCPLWMHGLLAEANASGKPVVEAPYTATSDVPRMEEQAPDIAWTPEQFGALLAGKPVTVDLFPGQAERVRGLEEMLRQVEFDDHDRCPVCGCTHQHAPDCALAKLLEDS